MMHALYITSLWYHGQPTLQPSSLVLFHFNNTRATSHRSGFPFGAGTSIFWFYISSLFCLQAFILIYLLCKSNQFFVQRKINV